ncbi:MAG: hypothetical protein RIB84_05415 [Sneathiellaceae bacterium]
MAFAIADVDRARAQDQNLGAAMLECAEIKPLFERLRCYDRLARDVDTFDSVVRETCGASATGRAEDPELDEARRRLTVDDAVAALRQSQAGLAGGGELQVKRNVQVQGIAVAPNWKVDEVRDGGGSLVEVRLSTAAKAPLTQGGSTPSFNILCRQRNTMMWLETGQSGDGDTTAVQLAFGADQEPITMTLNNTQNGKAMGIWDGAEGSLKPLLPKQSMTAQFTPKGAGKPVQAQFDLSGFEDAIEVIRLQCGW